MRRHAKAPSAGSTQGRAVAALLFACGLLLAFVPQALAASGEVGSFAGGGSGEGGSGSEDGQLLNPGQIDVYDATGAIYVADTGNDRVQLFTPTEAAATFSAKATVQDPTGLAIDQGTGSVYVATETGIAKLEADLDPAAGWSDPGLTGALTLAVDPTTGDLLVAERDTDTVHRFEADGTADSIFTAARPIDLAADSSGDVLVLTSTGDIVGDCGASAAIERFSSAGVSEGAVGGTLSAPGALAVDPDDDSILVAERVNQYNCGSAVPQVTILDSTGALIESAALAPSGDSTQNTQYAMVPGLAAQGDGSTRVYAATKSPVGDQYGATKITAIEELFPPEVTIDPVGAITSTGATLSGTVDPNGKATQWRFEYRLTGESEWRQTATQSASGEDPVLTGDIALTGLEAKSAYEARLVATSLHGEDATDPESFQTDASAPTAITLPPGQLESESAVLRASVNANNEETTYHFEWGTTTAYGNSAPLTEDGDAGGTGQPVLAVEPLTGLSPNTTYHHRVVATNATGTTTGDDIAFTTPATAGPCPNEAIRAEQNATYLPDCRAYEMVSPPDKNGADVAGNYMSTNASADGNSASFISSGAWGTSGTGQSGYSAYIYDRGVNSWTGGGISIYQDSNIANGIKQNNLYLGLAEDLSAGVLIVREPHPAPGGTPGVENFFTWKRADNLFKAATPNLSGVPIPDAIVQPRFAGATPDFEQIVFESVLNLTPNAGGSEEKTYHWDGNTLHLAGILPGPGEFPATKSVIGDGSAPRTSNPISDDGSKVFFTDVTSYSDTHVFAKVGPLYMRVDNAETMMLNEEENTLESVPLGDAHFLFATRDGSRVFFTSDQRLVAADSDAEGVAGRDLYAYDTTLPSSAQNLTLISDPSALPGADHGVLGLLGTSDDGSRVYFVVQGKRYAQNSGLMEIFVSDEGEVRHVAGIGEDPGAGLVLDQANYLPGIGNPQGGDLADVTSDGRYLLFSSVRQQPDDFDNAGFPQLYRYDLLEEDVACASCDPGASEATGGAQVHVVQFLTPNSPTDERALSADGSEIFFHSDDSLVSRDTNEERDAYVYDAATGRVSLLSSGKSPFSSEYVAAGKDGKTAFILTRERLVGADKDDLRDLYAVRVNGGFREPPPPTPCEGVSCLGAPSNQPPTERSATGSFSGPGNQRPADCTKAQKKAAKATRKAKMAGKQSKQARKLNAKAKQLKEKARKCSAR